MDAIEEVFVNGPRKSKPQAGDGGDGTLDVREDDPGSPASGNAASDEEPYGMALVNVAPKPPDLRPSQSMNRMFNYADDYRRYSDQALSDVEQARLELEKKQREWHDNRLQ